MGAESDLQPLASGRVRRQGGEGAGPDGCEVMLIGAGSFPLPTFDPAVDPPPGNAD